jgi:hypothetical protein
MRQTAILAVAALALTLVACGRAPVPTTAAAPGTPGGPAGVAVVESVRAYLRAFKLNEKDLPVGLTIPWGVAHDDSTTVGAVRATGKIGPQGHQIYETFLLWSTAAPSRGGETLMSHDFLEIAPEPESAPAPAAR